MKEHHVFPWWAGYLLISPFRKWRMNPEKLLKKFITPGMNILDAGCAMGFFSLPMATITGDKGKVFCIDPQLRMLAVLDKRAQKKKLNNIITTRECSFGSLMLEDLSNQIDFAFSFAVLHEVTDKSRFINEIFTTVKSNGTFLIGEPHVITETEFQGELEIITQEGFLVEEQFTNRKNHFAIIRK